MSILSDLSGPVLEQGFESYLTAYPLEADGFLVFARTWYAFEAERRGSVWTHSLLLNEEALNAHPQSTALQNLFRKPHASVSGKPYSEAISLETGASESSQSPDMESSGAVAQMLKALIDFPGSPILIPSRDSLRYEAAGLAIWELLWPAFRGRFSLCTGALTNRSIDSHPFDLQVVPDYSYQTVIRSIKDRDVPDLSKPWDTGSLTMNVCFGLRDLAADLRRFAVDVAPTRQSFAGLAKAWNLVRDADLESAITSTATSFTLPAEALDLKTDIFTTDVKDPQSWSKLLVRAAEPGTSAALSGVPEGALLYSCERISKDRVLARDTMNSIGIGNVTGRRIFTLLLSLSSFSSIVEQLPAMQGSKLRCALEERPEIALNPAFWEALPARNVEDALSWTALGTESDRLPALFEMLLDLNVPEIPALTVRTFSKELPVLWEVVLRATLTLSDEWRKELSRGAEIGGGVVASTPGLHAGALSTLLDLLDESQLGQESPPYSADYWSPRMTVSISSQLSNSALIALTAIARNSPNPTARLKLATTLLRCLEATRSFSKEDAERFRAIFGAADDESRGLEIVDFRRPLLRIYMVTPDSEAAFLDAHLSPQELRAALQDIVASRSGDPYARKLQTFAKKNRVAAWIREMIAEFRPKSRWKRRPRRK